MKHYTAKGIAEKFGLGVSTVRGWMHVGKIKAVKKSGTWITTADEIKEFLVACNPNKTRTETEHLISGLFDDERL